MQASRDSKSASTDADLIASDMRLVELDGLHLLQVGVLDWPHPHVPEVIWKTARRWKRPPTSERLAKAQRQALLTPRFFRVCAGCGQRHNAGHMDGDSCHGCMQAIGVAF